MNSVTWRLFGPCERGNHGICDVVHVTSRCTCECHPSYEYTEGKIYKHRYVITILSERELGLAIDLEDLNYLITDGDCIGDLALESCEVLAPQRVKAELIDIGNDGTFFDEEEDVPDDNA